MSGRRQIALRPRGQHSPRRTKWPIWQCFIWTGYPSVRYASPSARPPMPKPLVNSFCDVPQRENASNARAASRTVQSSDRPMGSSSGLLTIAMALAHRVSGTSRVTLSEAVAPLQQQSDWDPRHCNRLLERAGRVAQEMGCVRLE